MSSMFRKIKKWTLWRSPPSETEKEIVYGVRAGCVGTLATPGVIAPTVGREREKNKLWMIVLEERERERKLG
jgi:hypothetical protein